MSTEERAIRALIHFAACAHDAMDNSEELPDGSSIIFKPYWDALCAALDILNELPDDRPGYIMSAPAKAQWALHNVAAGLARAEGWKLAPVEPDDNMLCAARDWSCEKYGKPIGNDAARACWRAMSAVAPAITTGDRTDGPDLEQEVKDAQASVAAAFKHKAEIMHELEVAEARVNFAIMRETKARFALRALTSGQHGSKT